MKTILALVCAIALAGCNGIIIDASAVAKIERDYNIGVKVFCGGVQAEAVVAANPNLGPALQHYLAQNSKVARDINFAIGVCTVLGYGAATPTIAPAGA